MVCYLPSEPSFSVLPGHQWPASIRKKPLFGVCTQIISWQFSVGLLWCVCRKCSLKTWLRTTVHLPNAPWRVPVCILFIASIHPPKRARQTAQFIPVDWCIQSLSEVPLCTRQGDARGKWKCCTHLRPQLFHTFWSSFIENNFDSHQRFMMSISYFI